MEKPLLNSKTLWGVGIAALIALGQAVGIGPESTILEAVQILAGAFGVYGIRDAIGTNAVKKK